MMITALKDEHNDAKLGSIYLNYCGSSDEDPHVSKQQLILHATER